MLREQKKKKKSFLEFYKNKGVWQIVFKNRKKDSFGLVIFLFTIEVKVSAFPLCSLVSYWKPYKELQIVDSEFIHYYIFNNNNMMYSFIFLR